MLASLFPGLSVLVCTLWQSSVVVLSCIGKHCIITRARRKLLSIQLYPKSLVHVWFTVYRASFRTKWHTYLCSFVTINAILSLLQDVLTMCTVTATSSARSFQCHRWQKKRLPQLHKIMQGHFTCVTSISSSCCK